MAKTTVNLRAIRAALGTEIVALEKAVTKGAAAVKQSRAGGKKAIADRHGKSLSHARRVLRKLKSQQKALSDYCCDVKTQNCDFSFE